MDLTNFAVGIYFINLIKLGILIYNYSFLKNIPSKKYLLNPWSFKALSLQS